ncbi:MAG: VTT domain-containing protein [Patescibacteria group bacterium]
MFDLIALIKTAGYFGIFLIIFAESGLLIGFFLPGDSLLFTAGFLASQGFLRISILMIGSFIAAVIGDSVGYSFGLRVGPKIFKREDSLIFHKDHLTRAQNFYAKHGGKAIILARFMPVVRTFAPILAGVGKMRYGTFLAYNIVGGFLWSIGLSGLGYWLGSTIPNVDKYLLPIIILIILLSIAPSIYHVLKDPVMRKHCWETGVKILKKLG